MRTWRNFYLMGAYELVHSIPKTAAETAGSPELVGALSIELKELIDPKEGPTSSGDPGPLPPAVGVDELVCAHQVEVRPRSRERDVAELLPDGRIRARPQHPQDRSRDGRVTQLVVLSHRSAP